MGERLYQNRIFYGWYIVIAAFIIMAVGWGITFNTASLFIEPISRDLGLSRETMNTTFSIRSICQLVVALSSIVIYSKFKMKSIMKAASIILPISFFLYSYIESQTTLYLLTSIYCTSIILLGPLPLSMILNNWFFERKGFVIGLALMGSGFGGMLFNFLTGIWITTYGWRITYKILAIILFIIIVPCVFLIIKIHPRDIGLTPLGKSNNCDEDKIDDNKIGSTGILISDALRNAKFWATLFSTVLISMSGVSLMNNLSPHLTNIGYSITFSANIAALSMGSLAFGKMILGYLFDRFGLKKTTLLSCVHIVLGCFSILFAKHNIALIMIIVCVGLGTSFLTVAYPIITDKVFGQKDYRTFFCLISASDSLGGMVSPIILGRIFDISGSYNPSFVVMTIIAIIGTVAFQYNLPKGS